MKKVIWILFILVLLGLWFLFLIKTPQLPISQKALNMLWIPTNIQSDFTDQTSTGAVGLANPASTNCVNNWWTLEILEWTGGQYGMCHLPDGTNCEERAYFRWECLSTTWDKWTVCTMEYAPVCASVAVQCIKAPCEPVEQTFGNRCTMNANKLATFLYDWECTGK